MRRRGDLEALVATAVQRFGRLDAIVNNAGIGPISRFDALRAGQPTDNAFIEAFNGRFRA